MRQGFCFFFQKEALPYALAEALEQPKAPRAPRRSNLSVRMSL
jgi:hypothetical protein